MKYVQCNRPGCHNRRLPSEMTRVEVQFDGEPLVGLVCSPEHAEDTERGWRAAGPVREVTAPIPAHDTDAVKAARRAVLATC